MSETPIGDAVAEELAFPPGDLTTDQLPGQESLEIAEDGTPDAFEAAADEDPAPQLNEDADDTFTDLPEGADDSEDLDGDDE